MTDSSRGDTPFRKDLCVTVDISPDEAGLIEKLIVLQNEATATDEYDNLRDEVDLITSSGISAEADVQVIEYAHDERGLIARIFGLPPRSSIESRWEITLRVR